VLVRDLLLASRVTTVARGLGVGVKLVRDPLALGSQTGSRRLIVDLNLPGALEAARQWMQATSGRVTAFVAHVDVEIASNARAAGITQVLARSAFVGAMPQLLGE
jgi:hypothetical protein